MADKITQREVLAVSTIGAVTLLAPEMAVAYEDKKALIYRVGLKENENTKSQRWWRYEVDGKVGWRNMESGRMIDIPDNNAQSQVVMHTYPLPDDGIPNAAQLFEEKESNHGGIRDAKYYVRGDLSWDIQDGSFADGALLQLYYSNDGGYPQRFLPVRISEGEYILVNFGSYMVLTEFTEYV